MAMSLACLYHLAIGGMAMPIMIDHLRGLWLYSSSMAPQIT